MNILFLSNWYPSADHPINGLFIKEHARSIKNQGHIIVILHIDVIDSKKILEVSFEEETDEMEMPVFHLIIKSRFWKFIHYNIWHIYLIADRYFRKQILPRFKPDLIHSNVIYPAGLLGHFWSRKLNIPHIISEHWSKTASFVGHSFYSMWLKNAYRDADYILPVSESLRKVILNFNIDEKKVIVVPNVIDNSIFNYRPKKKADPRQVSFLSVAKLDKTRKVTKRPDLILRSLALVKPQISKEIELVFIGGGNMVGELKELAAELDLNVNFHGHIRKREIPFYLHKADFLLHASDFETFGIVVLESLKTGTPVIVSKLPVFEDIVTESNGVLAPNDVTSWSDAIKKALEISWDHKKIADSVSDKYSQHTVGQMISSIYLKTQP